MGFERVNLFAIVELDYLAPNGGTMLFYTDQPGNALSQRVAYSLTPSAVRRTIKFRLNETVKGKLYRVKVTSSGAVILFGGRVYTRPLGVAANWQWIPLPIRGTGDADAFTEVKLPIEATSALFSGVKLPMQATPEVYDWVDVPVAR